MIPLIKLRTTYYKRKKVTFFCSYLLIPIVLLIVILYVKIVNNISIVDTIEEKKVFGYNLTQYLFPNNSTYVDLLIYLQNTSIVINDLKLGEELQSFIENNTGVKVKYYDNENKLDNYSQNIIQFQYDSKEKSYQIKYIEKQTTGISFFLHFPFDTGSLSSLAASDVFNYNREIKQNNFSSYFTVSEQNKYFLLYQSLFAKFLIFHEKNEQIPEKNINFNYGFNSYPTSTQGPTDTYFNMVFSYIVGFQFTIGFIFLCTQMLEEKDLKLEKFLERQGISTLQYCITWFFNYLIVMLFMNFIILLFLMTFFNHHRWLFLFNLILINLSQFSLLYLMFVINKNKKTGLIVATIINFISLILGNVMVQKYVNVFSILMNLFFPIMNIFSIINCFCQIQTFPNFSFDILLIKTYGINYLTITILNLVQIIIFIGLSIFIKKYKNSGLPFCDFLKSLFSKKVTIRISDTLINTDTNIETNFKSYHEKLSDTNVELKKNGQFLSINNITKIYGDLKAVNNFSGELFKNEIFCLLGHNGAGKTTLIKTISGEEDPDKGDIFLNGTSLITNKDFLYHNIGLCQQEDIFFDYLTVTEHLKYMMQIKGYHKDLEQINTLIKKIELEEKKDAICKTLSGGQKRKLCIALALIGNSPLVLLDEPTSGMDVIAKRSLWDFLKEFKNDKIIVLTTHSLDEAEYLGDRIGIMSNGNFICSGTSSFLKEKYPCGFNLNLLVNSKIFNDDYKKELFNKLLTLEPKLEIKVASKGVFTVNIQYDNKNVKEIFDVVEKNKDNYGIEDYTVSSTSLEDVFLKLNNKITLNENNDEIAPNDIEALNIDKYDNLNNELSSSFCFQLSSHFKRIVVSIWRNKLYTFLEFMVGIIFIQAYVFIYKASLDSKNVKSLDFSKLYEYTPSSYIYEENDYIEKSFYYDNLLTKKGNFNKIDKNLLLPDFIEEIYQKSLAHIGKSGLSISKKNDNELLVYATEIPMNCPSFIMGNVMMAVSAFLKNEYGINAAILYTIEHHSTSDDFGLNIDITEMSLMFSVCCVLYMAVCIFYGSIMSEKIKERVKNIKHLLYLSGSNMFSYWGAFYITDLIKLFIFCSLAGISVYFLSSVAFHLWVNLIIYSFSSLFFIYNLSFLLEKEESGQKSLMIINFVCIILGVVIVILCLSAFNLSPVFLLNNYNYTIFDITPISSLLLSSGRIILSYYIFKGYGSIFDDLPDEINGIYSPSKYLLTSLMTQVIDTFLYLGLLALMESGLIEKLFNKFKVKFLIKDSNTVLSTIQVSEEFKENNNIITNEQQSPLLSISENERGSTEKNNCIQEQINKINADENNNLTTKIIGLKKTYWLCCKKKNVRAINNLYLGLENNEKFGLLGFNGSGKTTTFKSITKEILYDSGSIILFNKNIENQFGSIRQNIGYCPQENPIFDYMKVREIISFYSNLKRINEPLSEILEKFDLDKYKDTTCIHLSGGNKRKLSFALALMNYPKILLLDEPSTGVDPESRRVMWKNIMSLSKKNKNFNMILSTHSMEEAEVLCDTVSWLKSGNFLSIGNPEKLKIMLSAGYKLHIKFILLDNNESVNSDIENLYRVVKGFGLQKDFIQENSNIGPYIGELNKVIEEVKDKCSEIEIKKINKDFSFEFNIHVIKEKQNELFTQVLNMKNENQKLSEISISMESLENILTKL